MAVHMFRCFIGQGDMSLADLETRVNEWVANNDEWAQDSTDHTLTERNTSVDGTGETYYARDVRFMQTDTKDNILQKFTDKLANKVAWFRVGYHVCPHDEETDIQAVDAESWTATVGSYVQLDNDRVSRGSVVVSEGDTVFTAGDDYEVDTDRGRIKALSGGALTDGDTYTVNYEHYASGGPCYWPLAEPAEWAAKDVTIPSGVPSIEVSA